MNRPSHVTALIGKPVFLITWRKEKERKPENKKGEFPGFRVTCGKLISPVFKNGLLVRAEVEIDGVPFCGTFEEAFACPITALIYLNKKLLEFYGEIDRDVFGSD